MIAGQRRLIVRNGSIPVMSDAGGTESPGREVSWSMGVIRTVSAGIP
jgi:hypothetical protein